MSDALRNARRLCLSYALIVVAACTVVPGASVGTASTPTAMPSTSGAPANPGPTPGALSPSAASRPSASPTGTAATTSPTTAHSRSTISPDDLRHDDPSLEALLPTHIGNVSLLRMSVPGREFSGGGDICSFVCPLEPQLMADGVGAELDDVHLAVALDAAVDHYLLVAWRISGATGTELRDARIAMFDSEPPYPMIADFRVGSDAVTVAIRSWFPNDTQFLVTRDDALIVITYPTDVHDGRPPKLPPGVAEIVAALP